VYPNGEQTRNKPGTNHEQMVNHEGFLLYTVLTCKGSPVKIFYVIYKE